MVSLPLSLPTYGSAGVGKPFPYLFVLQGMWVVTITGEYWEVRTQGRASKQNRTSN